MGKKKKRKEKNKKENGKIKPETLMLTEKRKPRKERIQV